MTPKEKAEELYNKYFYANFGMNVLEYDERHTPIENEVRYRMTKHTAKQCALIAVEFAREQFYKYCSAEMCTDGTYDDHFDRLKQEIENL